MTHWLFRAQLARCEEWLKAGCYETHDALNCGAATSFCQEQISLPFWQTGTFLEVARELVW